MRCATGCRRRPSTPPQRSAGRNPSVKPSRVLLADDPRDRPPGLSSAPARRRRILRPQGEQLKRGALHFFYEEVLVSDGCPLPCTPRYTRSCSRKLLHTGTTRLTGR